MNKVEKFWVVVALIVIIGANIVLAVRDCKSDRHPWPAENHVEVQR